MFIFQALKPGSNELRYILLFIVSIVLVCWQYFGMETRLDVVPSAVPALSPAVHDDHINGGVSVTTINEKQGNIEIDCEIILSNTFAFCGVSIPMVKPGEPGVDLGKYDLMEIKLDYQSAAADTLLIYMINNEKTLSGVPVLKSNMQAISPQPGINIIQLATRQFYVPSWWLFQNNESGADSEPHISNVTALQITSGDNIIARKLKLTINEITFHGKLVSADDLYLGLLVAWLLLFSVHALYNMRQLSERIKESRRQNHELRELNHFLSIQKNQYETMAKHDKLTGALNRAGARGILEAVLKEYQHYGTPCSLLAMDIDHFKDINDEFGHDVGDNVLINLTRFVDGHTRDRDTFVRWGGEEFMLICPHTSLRAAQNLAETLRHKIENADLSTHKKITCSIGVAVLNGADIKEWFKRADQALYDAKSAGRNTVRTA